MTLVPRRWLCSVLHHSSLQKGTLGLQFYSASWQSVFFPHPQSVFLEVLVQAIWGPSTLPFSMETWNLIIVSRRISVNKYQMVITSIPPQTADAGQEGWWLFLTLLFATTLLQEFLKIRGREPILLVFLNGVIRVCNNCNEKAENHVYEKADEGI